MFFFLGIESGLELLVSFTVFISVKGWCDHWGIWFENFSWSDGGFRYVCCHKDSFVYYCPPISNAQSSDTDDGHFDISSHTKDMVDICNPASVGLTVCYICETQVSCKLPNMHTDVFDVRRFVPQKRFFHFIESSFMTMSSWLRCYCVLARTV